MSLFNEIINNKKTEVELAKKSRPAEELLKMVSENRSRHVFRSLKKSIDDVTRKYGFGIIGEIKKKSPSMHSMDANNVEKALEVYNRFPIINSISVLTDEKYFGQTIYDLENISKNTNKPVLRKDFIVDEYQILEAKAFGADAILLMSSVHKNSPSKFHDLYNYARSIDLEVLIEFGMECTPNIDFIPKSAELFGINSRGFKKNAAGWLMSFFFEKDASTNKNRHFQLIKKLTGIIGQNKTIIAESGIDNPVELDKLLMEGYSGALIGTGFLKRERIQDTVNSFSAYINKNYKKNSVSLKTQSQYAKV